MFFDQAIRTLTSASHSDAAICHHRIAMAATHASFKTDAGHCFLTEAQLDNFNQASRTPASASLALEARSKTVTCASMR